jgi:DNA-binding transcriptional ArsR family regulator
MTTATQDQVELFAGRVIGDMAGTMATLFCALFDKLGLFTALVDGGPATAEELAERASIDERYASEWLRGLTAAGYLEFDRDRGRFDLPPAHASVLADEGGAMFLGGGYQELAGMLPALGRIEAAFREGGGVPQAAYDDDAYDGMARFTRGWFDHRLTTEWLPLAPELEKRVQEGVRWADVGCGAGHAMLQLAEAFPASTFVG